MACADPVHADIDTLGDWIADWETALVLRAEDTSSVLVAAMCGLTSWHRFLQDGTSSPITAMAFTLLDIAGFEHYDAEFDTRPLADPRVIDQFRTINELLTETPSLPPSTASATPLGDQVNALTIDRRSAI